MRKTSMQLFREHIVRREDGTLDVLGLIERPCYTQWLASRFALESEAEAKKYHRTLTNHVSGVDGRTAFDPEEEEAILALFRLKQPWPCLPKSLSSIGKRYRTKGYHEKQRLNKPSFSSALTIVNEEEEEATPVLKLDPDLSDVEEMFRVLSVTDATYVRNLQDQIVKIFVTPHYNLQDWQEISKIIRHMVLAKSTPPGDLLFQDKVPLAQELCDKFSIDRDTVVMVFDMTESLFSQRTLVRNQCSLEWFDSFDTASLVVSWEVRRVVSAVGAAYHQVGRGFWVYGQDTRCKGDLCYRFDMCYYVDPATRFLVLFGKPCGTVKRLA